MSNSPGQVPNPTPQPQQPQAPPTVSDKTIDAFMAVSDDKKREALGKMSEPTKQALLQGIKTRKGVQTTPVQPPKPEGFINKAKQFMGAGPTIPAKPLTNTEKANPFTSGIASGSMMDPSKLSQARTTGEFAKEYASQIGSGMKQFGGSILKDPLNVGNAIDSITASQAQAYRKVRDGLKNGDHDLLMNGLGEAVGDLSLLLGGAKSAKEGLGVKSLASSSKFAAKDITAKRAIVSAASNEYLDALKETHSKTIDAGIAAENAKIGANVNAINIADVAKDPKGFKPTIDVVNKLNDSVTTKKASVMLQEGKLPKTSQLKSLIAGHGPNLTFNDLKYIRTVAEGLQAKADGVDYAVITDNIKYLTDEMKSRAGSLGKIKELEDYNNDTIKVKGLENGIVADLKSTKTGLEYAKKIAQGSNKGQLDKIIQGLHLPTDFFSDAVKEHKTIINYAKMSEGDSIMAQTVNRVMALRNHLITSGAGAAIGTGLGKAIGSALGFPGSSMAGSIAGFTLGAGMAHELMSKYDAARAIREIGGPSGVMGRPQVPPSQTPPSGAAPQTGPGGGGSPSPTRPPATLPGSPPSSSGGAPLVLNTINSKLKNLLAPSWVKEAEAKVDAALDAERKDSQARLDKLPKEPPKGTNAFDKPDTRTEPQVTKAPPEARGREASVRKGMTKDTLEARKAKAAERIAAKRSEASRTQVKTSLEDQARQVAGRMDFQGKSNIELEEGLQELYGDNGKRFLKEFKNIAKEKKWSDDVYRGYLMETIDKRAKELAQRPNVPGLGMEPKVE